MSALVIPKKKFWVPSFEPWRILRPLMSGLQPIGEGVVESHHSSMSSIESGTTGRQAPAAGGGPSAKATATAKSGGSNVSSLAPSVPSAASGDLLIAIAYNGNSGDWTVPSGWTAMGGTTGTRALACYKTSDGTETSVTMATNTNNKMVAAVLNCDQATFDVTAKDNPNNGSDPMTMPTITITNNDSFALAFFAERSEPETADAGDFFSPPTGYTEWLEYGNDIGQRGKIYVCYKEGVSSGATGELTSAINGQNSVSNPWSWQAAIY